MQCIDHVSSVMSKWGRATAKGDRKVLERFPGSKEVLDTVLSKVLDSSGYGSVLERFQRRYPKRHTFQHTSRAVWDVTWANLTKELSICYKFVHQIPILRPLTLRHCTWGSCLYIISSLYHSMLIIYMLSTNQDKFSFLCAHPSMKQLTLFLPFPLRTPAAPSWYYDCGCVRGALPKHSTGWSFSAFPQGGRLTAWNRGLQKAALEAWSSIFVGRSKISKQASL